METNHQPTILVSRIQANNSRIVRLGNMVVGNLSWLTHISQWIRMSQLGESTNRMGVWSANERDHSSIVRFVFLVNNLISLIYSIDCIGRCYGHGSKPNDTLVNIKSLVNGWSSPKKCCITRLDPTSYSLALNRL